MKVAVTGASGHIGNCLVRELLKRSAQVKVLVHNFRNDLDTMNVEIVVGNLLEPGSLHQLCKGVDVVFHLAAQIAIDNRSAKYVYSINVTGTKNIIDAAIRAGVGRFIHFSSIHAFQTDSREKALTEERPLIKTNRAIYEFTKAESERVVLSAVAKGFDAVILNPTAVIGPFDYRGSFLGQALVKIYNSKLPFLIAGGYNWVDVRDVVAASINAIEAGKTGENYILSGSYCTLKELSVSIKKISGGSVPKQVPVFLARLATPFFGLYALLSGKDPLYTNQSLNILANSPRSISCKKAQDDLKYAPRPLEQTLRDTFDWYKNTDNPTFI